MRTGPRALLQCYLPGCLRMARARGLCEKHYVQAWRRGDFDGREKETFRKGRVLSFWVSEDAAEKLEKLIRVTGFSQSHLLRTAMEGLLQAPSKPKPPSGGA